MSEHLFELIDGGVAPTELTTGPWRSDAMHGGPPAAILGRFIESELGEDEHLARIAVELERPVPLSELMIEIERRQVSRRVAHLDATASVRRPDGGRLRVASARGLALRGTPLPDPATPTAEVTPSIGPDEAPVLPAPAWTAGEGIAYHRDAVEHRFLLGGWSEPGPAISWARLRVALVDGEPTSGRCLVLALADFGSGISALYGADSGVGLINADLTVAFHRSPTGPWVLLDATTTADTSAGLGLGVTHISDRRGRVAVGTQSLLGYRTG